MFKIKHYIKEYFCLCCQGVKILLSPTENFKHDENGSPIYTKRRFKNIVFPIIWNEVLHGNSGYHFHQESESLFISLNCVASNSPVLVTEAT